MSAQAPLHLDNGFASLVDHLSELGAGVDALIDEAELAVEALRMALATRKVEPGLVHHSDRGAQYASSAYIDLLKEQGIHISMSRPGNPYDNAQAERFMRTLKYEEVYLFEYESMAEARARISHFLEEVYNQKRLHSAIGYVPPAEYEQQLCQTTDA